MPEQGNIPIAEDLQDDYNNLASNAGGVVVVGWRKYARGLIERCSRAEAEVAQLKADNLRLKAPVSDEEHEKHFDRMYEDDVYAKAYREDVDALLTARTQGGSNGK